MVKKWTKFWKSVYFKTNQEYDEKSIWFYNYCKIFKTTFETYCINYDNSFIIRSPSVLFFLLRTALATYKVWDLKFLWFSSILKLFKFHIQDIMYVGQLNWFQNNVWFSIDILQTLKHIPVQLCLQSVYESLQKWAKEL